MTMMIRVRVTNSSETNCWKLVNIVGESFKLYLSTWVLLIKCVRCRGLLTTDVTWCVIRRTSVGHVNMHVTACVLFTAISGRVCVSAVMQQSQVSMILLYVVLNLFLPRCTNPTMTLGHALRCHVDWRTAYRWHCLLKSCSTCVRSSLGETSVCSVSLCVGCRFVRREVGRRRLVLRVEI